jgi:putative copper export protein
MDWIHFMAVSIWIGGLFYLSLIFLKNIKPVEYDGTVNRANSVSDISNDLVSIHNVSISLMYFSFVIIIALCVIGISGLILGFMHLQDLNSLFGTSYGQILVLKLGLVFPLIFIGRYNQLKIYKNTSLVSFLVKNKGNNDTTDSISDPYQQTRVELFKKLNRSLKIESLLGIAVLIVAAFLSVTSPPSLEATDQDTFNIQSSNVSESGSSFFFLLVISLVVIISIIGVVNFRKNQKQVKEIFAITGDGN